MEILVRDTWWIIQPYMHIKIPVTSDLSWNNHGKANDIPGKANDIPGKDNDIPGKANDIPGKANDNR